MHNEINIQDLGGLDRAAGEFLEKIGDSRIVAFFAPMGAGKTTFTTAVCHRLGVEDTVCSPTFTIVNEYLTAAGEPVYHFDFYRINKIEEAYDFGYEDYFYSGALCFIEWPEKVEELLPEDCANVFISENEDGSRSITCEELS